MENTQNDYYLIEYRKKADSLLYIEKYFPSFEEALKRRDQILSKGFHDPIIKKMCKESHGNFNPNPAKQRVAFGHYRRNCSSFGHCCGDPNTKRRNLARKVI